jgi:predicted NodU family carbamoyl transferase
MVESPRDAIEGMHSMGLDALAIGDYLAWREGREP